MSAILNLYVLIYIIAATNGDTFHIIPYFAKKNAPAQSYLSGGEIVPKETQGGNWIFASTWQAPF